MTMHLSVKRACLVSVVALSAAGCTHSNLHESRTAASLDDAGTVHVAVVSAVPWDDVVDSLQPTFDLSAADAVKAVVPQTSNLEEKIVDAFRAQAGIGLPRTSLTRETKTEFADGTTSTTSTSTKKKEVGEVPDAASDLGGFPASSGLTAAGGDKLGIPAGLQYRAAMALYEEVKILNRVLKDAAKSKDYRPFLVRLQVGVMPYQRDLGYDVFSTMAFFAEDTNGASSALPVAVPLLVTDDLERNAHSRAIDTALKLSVALTAMVNGTGLSAGLDKVKEDLKAFAGSDYNSLLTVSKVSQNTIQARLGAMRQTAAGHAVVPQTNYVTVLLLVPEKAFKSDGTHVGMRVIARNRWRDIGTGQELTADRKHFEAKLMDTLVWNLGDEKKALEAMMNEAALDSLARAVQHGDKQKFNAAATSLKVDKENWESLWVDMSTIIWGGPYGGDRFQLADRSPPQLPTPQIVRLVDDGKTSAVATMIGGQGLIPGKMTAEMRVPQWQAPLMGKIAATNGTVTVTFPSLVAAGADGKTVSGLVLTHEGLPTQGSLSWRYDTAYSQAAPVPAATAPGFSLRGSNMVRASKAGTGTITVTVDLADKGADSALLSIANADIAKVTAVQGKATARLDQILVASDATVSVDLINLMPGRTVAVTAAGKKGAADTASSTHSVFVQ